MPAAKSSHSAKPSKRKRTLSQAAVVDAIRQAILSNNLSPGQRLVESELGKLLGCSHGTARSALMDLTHEGLVERIAHQGARVRVVGLQEALHIAEARLAVETVCVTRAAQRITDAEVRELRTLAKQMRDRAQEGDVAGFAESIHRIVAAYARIADQPVVQELLQRLRAQNAHHRFRLIYRPGRARAAVPFWLDIVDAICRRNPSEAARALKRHSENVREVMEALAHEHEPFAALSGRGGKPREAPAPTSRLGPAAPGSRPVRRP
jgi:DNA-binding GntR family transcriptional regulator